MFDADENSVRTIRNQDELARHLGVTRLTVRRALTGKAGVGEARRRQIIETATKLGYRVNTAARATVTGRTNCVAMLLSTEGRRSTLFPDLIVGASDALAMHGIHLTLARVADDKLTDDRFVPKALAEWMSDGLLINYNQEIPPKLLELIERHSIPSVWVNSKQAADCIYPDDWGAAVEITERLLALGHQRIAFVSYAPPYHYSVQDRRNGYVHAMQAAGRNPLCLGQWQHLRRADTPGDDCDPLTHQWLSQPDRPSAVVTYSLREAASVLFTATRLGLRVPQDLSIITIAETVQDDLSVPLSRMWIDRGNIGRQAAQMIVEKIQNPAHRFAPVSAPLRWWAGVSCGPCVT